MPENDETEGPIETPSEEAPNAPSNSNPDETPAEALGDRPELVERDFPEPVIVDDSNAFEDPGPLEPGPVEGSEEAEKYRRFLVGPEGQGAALREPVEKGNQEGKIGVVDRELTPIGEAIGITHGVVSHDLRAEGVEQTDGLPYMRCPNCGNVNITLHRKDRTVASCPSCLWHSGSLHSTQPNPADRIPGMHETPGTFHDAYEIPKGKLEGALGMDPIEAKQGVPVEPVRTAEVTTFHLDAEGRPILAGGRPFVRPVEEHPTTDREDVLPGNVSTSEMTTTKNRR